MYEFHVSIVLMQRYILYSLHSLFPANISINHRYVTGISILFI